MADDKEPIHMEKPENDDSWYDTAERGITIVRLMMEAEAAAKAKQDLEAI